MRGEEGKEEERGGLKKFFFLLGENELKAKANSYRGLLVIMTPELTGGSLTPKTIYNTIQFLQKVHFTIVCYFQQVKKKNYLIQTYKYFPYYVFLTKNLILGFTKCK